jgi:hypothetical protein
MNKKPSSLVFKLVLLYAALTIVLGLAFGIDLAGWWAKPVYNGLSTVINGLLGLFQ